MTDCKWHSRLANEHERGVQREVLRPALGLRLDRTTLEHYYTIVASIPGKGIACVALIAVFFSLIGDCLKDDPA